MSKIKKLIIPAAGWGTRFLPMTKITPKELLPILNKPSIDLLVEEAIKSGIEEIILVISPRKQEIMQYFMPNIPLEEELKSKNKKDLLKKISHSNKESIIRVVYQYEQLGLGHAILTGGRFFKNEPFAVILGDDLIKSDVPVILQMMQEYEKHESSILGVQAVESNQISNYGVVAPKNKDDLNKESFEIENAVEKPKFEDAPSNLAILGRYIFNYSIIEHLEALEILSNQEMNIVDAFPSFLKQEKIYAYKFKGKRYDLGGIDGFSKAIIDYSLEDNEIKDSIEQYILETAKNIMIKKGKK